MFAPSSTEFIRSGQSDLCAAQETTAVVLIPARNEAATIGAVVGGCRRAGFSVTVIDDASTDATAFLAAQAGAEVVTLAGPHHGKTAALHHAMARLAGSIDWLFFIDGDGQHDVVATFLTVCVFGAQHLAPGEDVSVPEHGVDGLKPGVAVGAVDDGVEASGQRYPRAEADSF